MELFIENYIRHRILAMTLGIAGCGVYIFIYLFVSFGML